MTQRKTLNVSVAGAATRAKKEDKKARDAAVKQMAASTNDAAVLDSFTNFAMKMGVGADNPLSTAGYGFNPISRVRTTLEWIHRGSWLGGVAVDVIADDMTRAGITVKGSIKPEQMEKLEESITTLAVWPKINETIKWARLYGGALAVLLIDGQDYSTPLRMETVGKGQFKGILVLDRWMVEPSLNNLITELGPNLGLPKFYTITADAPALLRAKIHHSRLVRLIGIEVPYWQRLQENLWGISVLERLYDRMLAFDSASTGAAQLVYKAYIRTYKIKGLREIVAAGGAPLRGLTAYVEMMRRFQGIEGMTLMDSEDEFEGQSHQAFSGLADALGEFKEQLSGALQIPLVRLFGQSPAGFSSGESDLRIYYDMIKQKQEDELKVGVTKIYRVAALSEGIEIPDGFGINFNSLWQLSDADKASIAETTGRTVGAAHEAGLISDQTALKELRQSSQVTGIFSNITEEDIANAAAEPEAPAPEVPGIGGEGEEGIPNEQQLKEDVPGLEKTDSGLPTPEKGAPTLLDNE